MKPKMWWFKRSSWPHLLARWIMLFATTGYVLLPTSMVWANPSGEQVVGGAATFDRQGNTLTVNQATDRLAVNWQDFSIAAGETTHFNMPSSASIALNRVLGGNPSQIYGTLSSNGNIILVNNAGIFVGPGGVVNAASFVGSTLDIDPGQFMAAGAGGFHLSGDSYAPIVNQGNITAEKGDVFLIAQKVENRGTISAPNGRAALVGAGRAADRTEVVLHEVGGSGFAVRVAQLEGEAAQGMNGSLPDGEELLNEGEISAAQAELNASGNIYALAIKNSGTIRAKAVVAQADGTVRLDGGLGDVQNTGTLIAKNAGDEATAAGGRIEVTGQNVTATPESIITAAGGEQGGNGGKVKLDSQDTTIVQGKVDVAAPAANAKGGKVELLGERVGLFEGAKVDASGGAGGGTVLAGGDYLGGNSPPPDLAARVALEDGPVKNAKATVMASTAEIKADATVNGDGGKVILWSDEYTGFYGQIFARGGAEGGDGGFVETSSARNLQAWGLVNASAPKGKAGTWLLDPDDITIVGGSSTNNATNSGGSFTALTNGATVGADAIVTALTNGASVSVSTSGGGTNSTGNGNIQVLAPINATLTAGQSASLTLSAAPGTGQISGSGNIGNASGGSLNITFNADSIASYSGTIATAGGFFTANTVTGNQMSGSITTANGAVTINNTGAGAINLAGGGINAGTGAITITQSGAQNIILQGLTSAGVVSVTSQGGNILLNAANYNLTGATATFNANAGNFNLDGGGNFAGTTTATLNIRGNGGVTIDGTLLTAGGTADININSDNGDISISGGVTGNNNINVAAGQNIRLSGTIDSSGGPGVLSLRANGGAIQPIAGIGTVTPNATTLTFIEATGNIRFNFGGDANFRAESTGGGNIQIEDVNPGGSDFLIGGNGIAGGAVIVRTGGILTIGGDHLGLGLVTTVPTVRSASFQAQAGGGIVFGLGTTESFPIVSTAGLQQYDSAVTLFDDPLVPGASENWLAAGQILFNAVDSLGGAGNSSLGLSGTPAVTLNGLIGGINPLQNFTIRGGGITFGVFTTRGNPLLPPPLDLPVGPAINAVGTISMDSAQLILQQSTWIRAGNDLTFGGAVTGFRDGEFPVFQVDSDAGNIVFLQNVGTAAIPLGRLDVISGDQLTSSGGGEISLVGPVITVPGTTPIIAGGDGAVSLVTHSATKGVVITGGINTAGGPNYQNTMIGGPVTLSAVNANVQLQGNVVTRGGAIGVTGPAFFSGVSNLDTTTDGTASGTITFNNTVDGLGGVVTLAAGTSLLTFSGELGSISPFDLNVTSAGGITFADSVLLGSGGTTLNSVAGPVIFQSSLDKLGGNIQATLGTSNLDFVGAVGSSRPFSLQVNSSGSITMDSAVRMGGAFTFNGVTGPVAVNSSLDGTFGFTVNPVNDAATVNLGTVGGIVPVSFLTVGVGNSAITLNGDITTAGGPITLGSPVTLGGSVNLNTTALGAVGGAINFSNSLGGSGVEDLTITAGGGGLSFGGPVSQLRDLVVATAGLFNFTSSANVTVARDILITPQVTSGGNVTMTAGRDVTLTGGLLARQDPGPGANVTITATAGDINVGAIIEISARSGTFVIASPDGSSFTTVGTPGFNSGSLTLEGNNITVGAVNAIGSNNFVTGGNGGNGGTVTLNSAGIKSIGAINVSGGNGGPAGRAGSIVLAGAGLNRLGGNITGNGGNGEAGSPGASGAVFDFSGQTVEISGATVQVTALGGSDSVGGGRGQDGNFTFGTLQSAASAQNNLLLNVGRGSITFGGQVGVDAAGTFGQITVVNALNVTFNDLLRTTRFVQNASVPDQTPYTLNSAGLTSFDEVILAGTGVAMELTGYNFTFGGPVDSTLGGGSIRVTNGGILAIRDDLNLGGNFTQLAAEDAVSARVEIGGNITTSSGAITLASNARLVDLATITIDTGSGGGAITFGALLDSDATARSLVLNSGGTVTLSGLVGSLNPLASLETNAGGSLVLAADGSDAVPSLNVTGGVVIRDQMSLQADTVVRSGSFALFNGGTIEGGQDLRFLMQGGSMILQGQVGGVTPLTSLWVEGADGGISLNFAGSELFPSVRTTAGQHYGSAVTLDSDNYLVSGGAMTFVNTIRAALNGGQGLTLDSGGIIRLQGLVGGGGLALSQLAVLGGGSLQFLANPGVDASVTTTGAQLYANALLLGQDTSLLSTTGGDFDFTTGATIDSLTLNQPRALTVNGQGKIVMEADLGSARRLGAVNLGAVGDITVLEGLDTFGGNVTMNTSAGTIVFAGNMTTGVAEQLGGNIALTAAQEIQLQGQLASRGGTVGMNASVYLSGASAIDTRSGGLQDGAVNFTGTLDGAATLAIQSGTSPISFSGEVGYQSPFVLTVLNSGGVTFQQEAMLGSGSSFTTAAGNLRFQNLLDVAGGGSLTIFQSPFDQAIFSGAVGSKNPFAMTLAAGGGITFEEAVVLGGTFNLATEGTGVEFLSTVDGAGSVVIETSVGNVRLNGAIGGATPLGAGGLLISVGTGSTTIGGNITTEGGAVAIGNTVILDTDVEIFTGAGLITTGRSISFNKAITAPGGQSLVLDAGSSGGILLGGSVGTAVTPLGSFTIRNGGGVAIGSSGGIFADGNVLINPELTGLFPKGILTISSASGGITLDKGGVLTGQFGDGNNNSDGSNLTMAAAGDIVVRSLLDLSGGDNDYDGGGSGFSSGTLTLLSTGGAVLLDTVQLFGGDAATVGAGGLGGVANIQAAGALTIRQLLANGGDGEGIVGGAGGNLTVVRTGATGAMAIGTVAAIGGDSAQSFGGLGGNITLRADLGDFAAPTDFFVAGGLGSTDRFSGQGGLVLIEATQGNLSFANQSLNLDGDGSLRVVAGENLILATTPDTTTPELSSGGVILNLNGQALRSDRRGTMSFAYGAANNGGQFYMPSSSYLLSNGGDVAINTAATANLVPVGRATLSGITTSGVSLNGGRILINQAPAVAGLVGDVIVLGTLETSGGNATVPAYGRTGGQVLITGAQVTLNKVITRGSDSLSSATVPAFGGAGGDVSVTATGITLRRDLDTSGGNGLGTGDANGGAGGQIQLFGNVVLNSGSANRTTIAWNTQGGTLSLDGDDGLGGNILVTGTLTGTPSTSNILDLRYGSGTVTLGDDAADTITLGTLITAADNARSTGILVINGALDVGTLTTYARGYGIQINGGGAVDNTVVFNNTGNINLGSLTATTEFAGGLDASAPAAVRLQGTIVSGDAANPGTGAPMTFGVAELVGNTILNSNGSNLSLGRIDGAFDLTLASGIGSGVVDISSTVGANTRLGTITVSEGIVQPVVFRDLVRATALDGEVGTALSFFGNVDLTGAATLQGLTTLDNTLFESQNSTLDFLVSAASSLNEVVLASGPIRLTGDGSYTINGTVTGNQNLKLAGAGAKLFASTVDVGSGVAGIDQADGSGTVTFEGDVLTSGVSTFDASVVLSGMTYTSADRVDFGGDIFDTVTLEAGTVTLAGAGEKVFNGTVNSDVGLVQDATAGKITFNENVTSTGAAGTFNLGGDVELVGMVFSADGAVTLSKAVTLSSGQVTLTGGGAYTVSATVNGNQNLVLAGLGTKSFTGTMGGITAIGTGAGASVNISGANVNFGVINTSSGISSTAALVLNGNVQISGTGDTDSNFGGTVQLAGITFTSGLGTLFGDVVTLSGGTTTLAGSGAYQLLDNLEAQTGAQSLAYTSTGDITLGGAVGSAIIRLSGLSQSVTAGGMEFQGNVFTSGSSSFAGDVILNGITFDANGTTSYNTLQIAGAAATLTGAGTQSVAGALTGNGFDLNLAGTGDRALGIMNDVGTLNIATSGTTTLGGSATASEIATDFGAGDLRLGSGIVLTTTVAGVNLNNAASITTLGNVDVNSAGDQSYETTLVLGGAFNANAGVGNQVSYGSVSGTGNMETTADLIEVSPTTVKNAGIFKGVQASGGAMSVGAGGTFMNAVSLGAVQSTGGLILETDGAITANTFTAGTGLSLISSGNFVSATSISAPSVALQAANDAIVNSVTTPGALAITTGTGSSTAFAGSSRAGSLSLDTGTVGALDSTLISVPSLDGINLRAAGNFSYSTPGNLGVSGRVVLQNGTVQLQSGGNFVNYYSGNPFSAHSTQILTRDFFSYPNSAGVPGFSPVIGATTFGQLGANQIGVALPLLTGSAGPFITEFTTGTDQPYILATQENAVPAVVMPATYTVAGAFPTRVSYTAEELEMMTPEERSAYEVEQRRQSARVLLERQPGQAEVGVPAEGEIPQAKALEPAQPAPTAQVILDGKPLAGRSDKEKGDSSQLLRVRPAKAVALRAELDMRGVMEDERLAAEVNVGSAPVAGR